METTAYTKKHKPSLKKIAPKVEGKPLLAAYATNEEVDALYAKARKTGDTLTDVVAGTGGLKHVYGQLTPSAKKEPAKPLSAVSAYCKAHPDAAANVPGKSFGEPLIAAYATEAEIEPLRIAYRRAGLSLQEQFSGKAGLSHLYGPALPDGIVQKSDAKKSANSSFMGFPLVKESVSVEEAEAERDRLKKAGKKVRLVKANEAGTVKHIYAK